MLCRTVDTKYACFTNAAGVRETLVLSIVHDATGKPMASYYTDNTGAVVDTSVGSVLLGECPLVSVPNGDDIPNNTGAFSLPVNFVKSFTVSNEGTDPVIVTVGGNDVTLHLAGSRTWGNGHDWMDVSAVSIQTGADSDADVIWEA